jgi:hypothetical protein
MKLQEPPKWDLMVDISGPLYGPWADWPNSIKDALYRAVEDQCCAPEGYTVMITKAACGYDPEDRVHYIAMEVVAIAKSSLN